MKKVSTLLLLLFIINTSLFAQNLKSLMTTILDVPSTEQKIMFHENKLYPELNGFTRFGTSNNINLPLQRIHVMGGSILLSRGNNSGLSGSQHGSIYFGLPDQPSPRYGIWGIEYNDSHCEGGLNFWKPATDKYPTENFLLFLRNDGYVGIGTSEPVQKFHVEGSSYVKNNIECHGSIGIGVTDPIEKLHVEGNAYIKSNIENGGIIKSKSLIAGNGKMMVIADQDGVLNVADMPEGDNLGNHSAVTDINLGNNRLYNKNLSDDYGRRYGVYLDSLNNLRTETGDNAHIMALAASKKSSSLWASSWSSGGYGLVLVSDNMGGIYCDYNNPFPVITFIGKKVGIGAAPLIDSKYNLFVAGGIETEEVLVKIQSEWADYVFDKDYHLMNHKELEDYIKLHGKLPDVPSAAEVSKNGINLGEMNAILLRKIEELTLLQIEMQKEIDKLKSSKNEN